MKLTILGCWGGYPKVNEATSGYLLEEDNFRLLIDCGSGVLAKLQNYLKPEELDAVVLSHYHADHIADIGVLQHARLIQGILGNQSSNLPIYGHALDKQEFSKLTYREITKGIAYDASSPLTVGPFTIRFLQTQHPVPCFAMRIESKQKSFVYTGDTAFKEEFNDFCSEVDLLLCECNLFGGQNGKAPGHMTSYDAGNLAQTARVKNLILTHLPHYGNLQQLVEEAAERYKGSILLAKQNMVYNIE